MPSVVTGGPGLPVVSDTPSLRTTWASTYSPHEIRSDDARALSYAPYRLALPPLALPDRLGFIDVKLLSLLWVEEVIGDNPMLSRIETGHHAPMIWKRQCWPLRL